MTESHISKLDALFNPKSIAVVGASTKPHTVGNDLVQNLITHKFTGSVYPVNPKAPDILGIKAYPSLTDLPEPVELIAVAVPAAAVLGVVEQAKAVGVKAMVLLSAGFKETGKEGLELERQLTRAVREAGIALVGPNCLGVINADPKIRLNATFARKMPQHGKLAFISQSGALCTSVLDYAEERQIGFSKFVSFGNKADVNEVDLLSYLAEDESTRVIAMYLEDIGDGTAFIETARQVFWKSGKPILCLKSGRSPEGAKAVSSHTGSLAGSDSVYDAIMLQSGIQRVDKISELFDYAALYTTQPLAKGKRLGIVTNAGGPGIMATDAAVRVGLKLAALSPETKDKLRASLPAAAALGNPVDVVGDAHADRYRSAVRTVLEDPEVDMGLVILTPQSMTEIEETARIIPEAVKDLGKPVVCSFMGASDVAEGAKILRSSGIPNYPFPEDAIFSLAGAEKLSSMLAIPDREEVKFDNLDVAKAKEIIEGALARGDKKYLTQSECRPIFECYGFPLLFSRMATSAAEAGEIVGAFGKPVVMKVMSEDVVHKFDAGGVVLNISGAEGAAKAYDQIVTNVSKSVPGAKIQGILIEGMAQKGVEVILGATRDAKFGPMLMFGLGGTFVEVLKDVTFRLAPMWRASAHRMIREIRAFKILTGVRGAPPSDLAAIEDVLLRLSALVTNHPEISELDINPLIVHAEGSGCSVADSRIMLKRLVR
ncbi:MAG: acetate--CoA ligase family protein [Acidobacteriota bacterium]|jgi:acetyltransferase|nr:acetate--CoA ligase family protein [Acidobacteriota bacterium]